MVEKFIIYLSGIVLHPNKTIKALVKEKNTSFLIILFLFFLLLGFITYSLVPLIFHKTTDLPYDLSYLDIYQKYGYYLVFISGALWLLQGAFIHFFTRFFKGKGKITKIWLLLGFINLAMGALSLAFTYLGVETSYRSLTSLCASLISLWSIYLISQAISSVYSISLVKGFIVQLISMAAQGILVLLIFLWVIVSFTPLFK